MNLLSIRKNSFYLLKILLQDVFTIFILIRNNNNCTKDKFLLSNIFLQTEYWIKRIVGKHVNILIFF